MKIVLIGIAILIIGGLFVLQDFGSQTTSDPVQKQPISQPTQSQQVPSQPTQSQQVQSPPSSQPSQTQQVQQPKCDPSYPAICIPPYPPDLDCGEIQYSNFRVVPPDPHGFDRDRDGTGCEVGSGIGSGSSIGAGSGSGVGCEGGWEVGWLCTGSVIVWEPKSCKTKRPPIIKIAIPISTIFIILLLCHLKLKIHCKRFERSRNYMILKPNTLKFLEYH